MFWQEHNPCGQSWSTQYKAILFWAGDEQRAAAEQSAQEVTSLRGSEVTTELVEFEQFWVAEDYHQKYALRRHSTLVESLRKQFATEAEFRDSPLTAKLNAWCSGDLDRDGLDRALADFGYRMTAERSGVEEL